MDTIEKRARQLLDDMHLLRNEEVKLEVLIAALTPPEGHVVVTRNEAGQAVAVTRQDDEGRILSVIAEFGTPEGYVLVPVEMTEPMLDVMWRAEDDMKDSDMQSLWAELIAARPEVKNVDD